MLDRELTYQMPFARLLKLSRSASRKAFAVSWRLVWLLIASYLAGLALVIVFARPIDNWLAQYGLPDLTPIVSLLIAFGIGFWLLRRYGQRQAKNRADYDSVVRFREDPEGLRFATTQVEYFIKWHGISQMLLEPDGVVFSHGNLFFLVPTEAFSSISERDTLVRDVFGRLSEVARARSEKFIRPVLDASASTAGI